MAKKINALTLLKKDHQEVKDLFDRFEETDDLEKKKQIALEAIQELKVHAKVEEELFYPALRKAGENEVIEEADEEHHVAKVVIGELELMKGDEDNYEAKFMVLAENVRHHIKEEESEVFSKARKSDMDLDALGEMMAERKEELKSAPLPPEPEEEMVKSAGLIQISPSKKAAEGFQLPGA